MLEPVLLSRDPLVKALLPQSGNTLDDRDLDEMRIGGKEQNDLHGPCPLPHGEEGSAVRGGEGAPQLGWNHLLFFAA